MEALKRLDILHLHNADSYIQHCNEFYCRSHYRVNVDHARRIAVCQKRKAGKRAALNEEDGVRQPSNLPRDTLTGSKLSKPSESSSWDCAWHATSLLGAHEDGLPLEVSTCNGIRHFSSCSSSSRTYLALPILSKLRHCSPSICWISKALTGALNKPAFLGSAQSTVG